VTIDNAVDVIDTMIVGRMQASCDTCFLALIAAGLEPDDIADVIVVGLDHFTATQPQRLADIREMLLREFPAGSVGRLTIQTP
jgi:hypothetical protein